MSKGTDLKDANLRTQYATRASVVGIITNFVLFLSKLIVGAVAGSVSIIADAFNNISDAGSGIVTFVGFRMSGKHADKKHPLGHGRTEYICAFLVDIIIILFSIELFRSSVLKILSPTLPGFSTVSLVLLFICILVKLWLFAFYNKVAKKINSAGFRANASDSISDVLATTLVFVGAIVSKYFGIMLDGWAGILVAGFILYTGIKASKETVELLLGASPDPALVKEIYDFVSSYSEVQGVHDLMVHDYGPGRKICTLHAEVAENCDLLYAHEIIDIIERDMQKHFGFIVTIHLDPIAVGNKRVSLMREFAEATAKEIDPTFTIHDFRLTGDKTLMTLIFDLCIPASSKYADEKAAELVAARIHEKNDKCRAIIHAEHPFV